uniref:Uncharacterized protein n=1 Tax=Anguilla anguilla TaxID=7936 RepID=A0A0E9VDD9_ANGAN
MIRPSAGVSLFSVLVQLLYKELPCFIIFPSEAKAVTPAFTEG